MDLARRPRASRLAARGALLGWGPAAVLVLSLALGGCAEEDDAPLRGVDAPSATPTPTTTPTPPSAPSDGTGLSASADSVEHREIGTFQATALKPVEDGSAATLKGVRGARAWLEGLGATSDVVDEIADAVERAAVTEDETLHGVILSTGCLAPRSWTLLRRDGGLSARTVPNEKEATTTCIAAVTTLAVVAVPKAD